jgi:hypothetical protein
MALPMWAAAQEQIEAAFGQRKTDLLVNQLHALQISVANIDSLG